jgi:hypothetical protein
MTNVYPFHVKHMYVYIRQLFFSLQRAREEILFGEVWMFKAEWETTAVVK